MAQEQGSTIYHIGELMNEQTNNYMYSMPGETAQAAQAMA